MEITPFRLTSPLTKLPPLAVVDCSSFGECPTGAALGSLPRFQFTACIRRQFIGIRRRPTLPGRYQPSTIGTEGLNFCVRDGNRCDPFVITTGNGEHIQAGSLRRPFLPLRLPACPALSQGTCLHGLNVSHADNCTAPRFTTVCFVSCDRCYPKSLDFGQL